MVTAYVIGLVLGALVGLMAASLCRTAATYSDYDDDEVEEAEDGGKDED